MGEFTTLAALEKDFKTIIEGIEKNLNFKDEEFRALEARVKTLEISNKSLDLEKKALKSQIDTMVNQITEKCNK